MVCLAVEEVQVLVNGSRGLASNKGHHLSVVQPIAVSQAVSGSTNNNPPLIRPSASFAKIPVASRFPGFAQTRAWGSAYTAHFRIERQCCAAATARTHPAFFRLCCCRTFARRRGRPGAPGGPCDQAPGPDSHAEHSRLAISSASVVTQPKNQNTEYGNRSIGGAPGVPCTRAPGTGSPR